MAIVPKEELLKFVEERFREDNSDEVLKFIEDFSDTINDDSDWKAKYDENDKMWRDKYKSRFFSEEPTPDLPNPEPGEETIDKADEPSAPTSYEELFTEKEE